jgi:rhodanese-related sulfurtransferase
MRALTSSPVTGIAAAEPAAALDHFQKLLAFETDCWDVHAAIAAGQQDFVLLDVRSPEAYRQGHVPGAISLPHRRIVERTLADFPKDALFVVYCSGPHCNGADRAAVQLSRLGRKVKKMLGGMHGWQVEGFATSTSDASSDAVNANSRSPAE